MAITKVATSLRLTPLALTYLQRLAEKRGLTRTAYLEMIIRQLAEREDADVEKVPFNPQDRDAPGGTFDS